jgi:hypothetical protein
MKPSAANRRASAAPNPALAPTPAIQATGGAPDPEEETKLCAEAADMNEAEGYTCVPARGTMQKR